MDKIADEDKPNDTMVQSKPPTVNIAGILLQFVSCRNPRLSELSTPSTAMSPPFAFVLLLFVLLLTLICLVLVCMSSCGHPRVGMVCRTVAGNVY